MRKRWQFGWCDENSPPTGGDAHDWRSKTFRAATFVDAMDLMLDYIRAKPFVCLVDYECAALHVPFDPKKHGEHFLRIDRTEHQLAEYAD
jgi:hypothetical protein